jgi:hypothetical protein
MSKEGIAFLSANYAEEAIVASKIGDRKLK